MHKWFVATTCPGPYLESKFPYIAKEVNKQLEDKSKEKPKSSEMLYRVRETWDDSKSQKGAFKVLSNAKACADKNPGYSVFDESGKLIYPISSTSDSTKFKSYLVSVKTPYLNIRKGPGTNYSRTGRYTGKGVFTIVGESDGVGASKWGKLKSGAGWISLDYCKRL